MKEYNYVVGKYAYQTPTQIEDVKKEAEAIAYIKASTDISNVKNAYQLYKKLNAKPSFKTALGLEFMEELFQIIVDSKMIQESNLEPIKVALFNPFQIEAEMDPDELTRRETKAEKKLKEYKVKNRNLCIIVAFLAVVIGTMFYIASTSEYSYISDYENKILDKYSAWEEELQQREQQLKEKEK